LVGQTFQAAGCGEPRDAAKERYWRQNNGTAVLREKLWVFGGRGLKESLTSGLCPADDGTASNYLAAGT
jgi:hypothetical protein